MIGAATLLLAAHVPKAAPAQGRPPDWFEVTGVLDPELAETSGVAASRILPGIFWTHNDSGNEPALYAITIEGELRGTIRFPGISSTTDWEDIALGPCPDSGQLSCLFIADTGDNLGRRDGAAIHILPEPAAPEPAGEEARATRTLHLRYADGAPDVEALAVAPTGEILLISKGTRGVPAVLYRIPPTEAAHDSVVAIPADTLVSAARPLTNVTAASISPDGTELVVRTYTELHFFSWSPNRPLVERSTPCHLGLRQAQGEAVDYLDGSTLVLTTEAAFGRPASIALVRCSR